MGAPIPNVIKKDESTSLRIFVPNSTLFQILLTDASGKKVFTSKYMATAGFNNITLATSGYNLAAGTYFLYVQGGEIRQTERLIVQ
jgi:sucrose-6-phosphate hydrolase SacC (GH32 family)